MACVSLSGAISIPVSGEWRTVSTTSITIHRSPFIFFLAAVRCSRLLGSPRVTNRKTSRFRQRATLFNRKPKACVLGEDTSIAVDSRAISQCHFGLKKARGLATRSVSEESAATTSSLTPRVTSGRQSGAVQPSCLLFQRRVTSDESSFA